jgi:TolB-like protein/DNA-binding winged helix-turn-helix (wHTH) protein/Flp pilus assembly protein TadD
VLISPEESKVYSMTPFSQSPRAVRFGVFEVDFEAGELRKHGIRIKLRGEQPFQVLSMLLERSGEVVTREELCKKLWPTDTFVDFEHSLATAISKIREALGDSAGSPRFIETLPRRGYRFIADVVVLDGAPLARTEPAIAPLPEQEAPARIEVDEKPPGLRIHLPWQLAWKIAVLALALVAVLAIWIFQLNSRASAPIRSLAVLPLENLSGDASQNYFADGMTDELITELAKISALRVISRTSVMMYQGAHKSLPQIARELNVDAVVEGSVQRSNNQVRITAQLIQARTDKHLWAQTYDGNLQDTLAVQKRVASDIAEQIRIEVTPQERAGLKSVRVVNPEAYEDYLRGRYFWNKRSADGVRKAIDSFNQAIAKDPNYAPAYIGLADTYINAGGWPWAFMDPKEAYQRAIAALNKALELDPTLGEAHSSRGMAIDQFVWDWDAAEQEFRRGIELNPGWATGHQWYADHLGEMGRNSEALAENRKAASLDPLSLIINAEGAMILVRARRYDEAIGQIQKTIEMDPGFSFAHFVLGTAYEQKRMYPEAILEFQKAIEFSGGNTTFKASLAHVLAVAGRKNDAVAILDDLKDRSKHEFLYPSEIALIYVGLGDQDQAMVWLEKAYHERFDPIVLTWPFFDPLRPDPRFQDLMRRIRLPS